MIPVSPVQMENTSIISDSYEIHLFGETTKPDFKIALCWCDVNCLFTFRVSEESEKIQETSRVIARGPRVVLWFQALIG